MQVWPVQVGTSTQHLAKDEVPLTTLCGRAALTWMDDPDNTVRVTKECKKCELSRMVRSLKL